MHLSQPPLDRSRFNLGYLKKKNGPRYSFVIDDPNEKIIQETKWL
jgi:hypothetical protein